MSPLRPETPLISRQRIFPAKIEERTSFLKERSKELLLSAAAPDRCIPRQQGYDHEN
jgi:hypothetical protein